MTLADDLADAVCGGALEQAAALLQAGADARAHTRRHPELWSVYFDSDAPLLHLAALRGNAAMVKLLLEHGAPLDERPSQERSYQTHDDTYEVPGWSALMLAASYGFLDVARVLVAAGADLDATDASHDSALKMASRASRRRQPHSRRARSGGE